MFLPIIVLHVISPFIECLKFCDQQNFIRSRVIGGSTASISEFPWQAAIVSYNNDGSGLMCGGTVIDEYWIMTAAHCIINRWQKSYILTGILSLSNPQHTVRVEQVVVHPQYDASQMANDIALVQSKRSLFSRGINSVCLTRNDSLLITIKEGIITGFGLHIVGGSPYSVIMGVSDVILKANVPIIPHQQCQREWLTLSGGGVVITDKQICAGSKLHGAAPGDSGGPLLVYDKSGQLFQIGITSFGAGGFQGLLDQRKYPGVYTRVASYANWIENVVKNTGTISFVSFITVFIYYGIVS
ncbi:trypsin [Dictyocaulus viviparus]|uniref:Trypsin n=1 Tax=Dictyocaulus viviparus TaxID=29172 RepID=A0A0D8YC25_DICVI|nr:trypsin [Dictyocaulus viviparus]